MKRKRFLLVMLAGLVMTACGITNDNIDIENTVIEEVVEKEVDVTEEIEEIAEEQLDITKNDNENDSLEENQTETYPVTENNTEPVIEEYEFYLAEESDFRIKTYYGTGEKYYTIIDGENEFDVHFEAENYFVPEATAGYKLDIDKDGDEEYVIVTCEGRGTGCYMQGLIIIDEGCDRVTKWIKAMDLSSLVNNRICYEYDETTRALLVKVDDEETKTLEIDEANEFVNAAIGDILYIEKDDKAFYINAALEYNYSNVPYPLFEPELFIFAPILIGENYEASLGDISTMVLEIPET